MSMPKIYICPDCHKELPIKDSQTLDEVALEHLNECPFVVQRPTSKRITDVVPPEVLAGNIITIEEILGAEVLVTNIDWHESTFREGEEYLELTLFIGEEERKLNTGATRVVEVFRAVNLKDLPFYCSFEKVQIPGGKRVYRVK